MGSPYCKISIARQGMKYCSFGSGASTVEEKLRQLSSCEIIFQQLILLEVSEAIQLP